MHFLVIFATFWAMELITWALHKYVMHGFLWNLHEDHHAPYQSTFQKNDTFLLIFAIPSWLAIMLGMMYGSDISVDMGIGTAIYGVVYFLLHEGLIHQRIKLFKRTDNFFFRAIRKAHKIHHKHQGKAHGECFGLLIVPVKYYKEALRRR
ncbi:sterol desaturase family protein [Pontibacter sp. G13]|uniref:sterol desaturase family protein n=1 Tax=Pontibacter sp. G13 TaxID=3074898 RepID=UPI00288B9A79|nr:sterol desaturase family protein [Pontibacter sp. G13]WNJ17053.1 sterol desaturase family protein [Pontibacter sp. G13]